MARVLGIHRLELKPGVDEGEFEKFINEKVAPLYHRYEPGQTAYLMKGDRGKRAGKYAILIDIDSVEERDHIYPSEGVLSEAFQNGVNANAAVIEKLMSYLVEFPDSGATDYVVISGAA